MQVVALIREENGVYRALFPDFPRGFRQPDDRAGVLYAGPTGSAR